MKSKRQKIAKSSYNIGKSNPNYRDGRSLRDNFCPICNKKIEYIAHYCQSCWQLESRNPNYNTKKHLSYFCKECGKELKFYKSVRCNSCENARRHKLGIIIIPNYGKTILRQKIWVSDMMKSWREKIYKRDNYTCQICYSTKRYLNAHHKIPVSFILNLYKIKTLK